MLDIEGFILAGGASSRMGREKALLELDGRRFVERIADTLSQFARKVSIVGSREDFEIAHVPNVPDIYERWGALGGLHTALATCTADWAAVVACDLPFITRELFVQLAFLSEGFDAVVPVQHDGRQQPLCALYKAASCADAARQLITSGERRPRALAEQIRTRWVAEDELSDIAGSANFFMNVNTPEDYEQARKKVMSNER